MAGEKTDKTVALLKLLSSLGSNQGGETGLHVVEVRTAEPDPVTLLMQGTKIALGPEIFEIPVDCYPLREGDRLLALPIVGGQRWAILAKINGGLVMATMQGATSCRPDGMQATYNVTTPELAPGQTQLQAGDRVSIAPTWEAGAVSYVVVNRY